MLASFKDVFIRQAAICPPHSTWCGDAIVFRAAADAEVMACVDLCLADMFYRVTPIEFNAARRDGRCQKLVAIRIRLEVLQWFDEEGWLWGRRLPNLSSNTGGHWLLYSNCGNSCVPDTAMADMP